MKGRVIIGSVTVALAMATGGCSGGQASGPSGAAPATGAASSSAAPTGDAQTPSSPAVATPPEANQLLAKVRAAVGSAKSVRIVASGLSDGKPMQMQLAGARDGSNGEFTIVMEGAKFDMIATGGDQFLKGDEKFWTEQGKETAGIATLLSGKWVRMPAAMKAPMSQFSVGTLLSSLEGDLTDGSVSATVETGQVGGKAVYVLTSTKGKDDGQIFVAADGSFLPVKFTGKAADQATATFSDWDRVAPVNAPTRDVLDLSTLR